MSFLLWLLTQKSDAPTRSPAEAEGGSSARQHALSGSTYDEQSQSLSPANNPLSPSYGVCTQTDQDGDGQLDNPPLGIDFDFNSGPSIGVAPEPQEMDCSLNALIDRLDRKHPGFRIRWIKAGPLNLSRTSTAQRQQVLMALAEERTACQAGSY
jgi:hypothetical protein